MFIRLTLACRRPLPLFELVQYGKKEQRQDGVRQGRERDVTPAPLRRLPKQAMSDAVVNPLVDDEEDIGDEKPGTRILNVDLDAERRRCKANNRIADAVHTQRVMGAGERILHEANDGPGNGSADGITPRDRKEDDHHHGQVNYREEAHLDRNESLDKDRCQGDHYGYRPTEFVNRNLLS